GVDELGEVGVEDLERLDHAVELRDQVDPIARRRDRFSDPARLRPPGASRERKVPEPVKPADDLSTHPLAVRLPELDRGAAVSVRRVLARDRLERRLQVRVLLGVAPPLTLPVVERRERQIHGSERGRKRVLLSRAPDERDLLGCRHPLRPKKFFRSAISTSFLPSSCSRSRIRRSYSRTVESSAKISGPFSRNCFFQSPTEFGCTSYAFATCASDLSSVRTSRTTWNLSFGEYVRRVALPM